MVDIGWRYELGVGYFDLTRATTSNQDTTVESGRKIILKGMNPIYMHFTLCDYSQTPCYALVVFFYVVALPSLKIIPVDLI